MNFANRAFCPTATNPPRQSFTSPSSLVAGSKPETSSSSTGSARTRFIRRHPTSSALLFLTLRRTSSSRAYMPSLFSEYRVEEGFPLANPLFAVSCAVSGGTTSPSTFSVSSHRQVQLLKHLREPITYVTFNPVYSSTILLLGLRPARGLHQSLVRASLPPRKRLVVSSSLSPCRFSPSLPVSRLLDTLYLIFRLPDCRFARLDLVDTMDLAVLHVSFPSVYRAPADLLLFLSLRIPLDRSPPVRWTVTFSS